MGAQDQGANAIEGRWLTVPRTLCFVRNGGDVLLLKRAAHKRIFPGRYNGLGGHIERYEDPAAGARREVLEESGLMVRDLRLHGVHHVDAGQATGILVFIFSAWSDSRETAECDEGTLHWVAPDALNGLDLVEDVAVIVGRILSDPEDAPPWFAHVSYDAGDQIVLRYSPPEPPVG